MSVFIRTLAFVGRLSSLIQSGRFLMQLEVHRSRGLLRFWQVWSKMENGLGWCLCSFCSCFCFGPFLSPKQTCSKGFMCMFSSLEFDHKYTVAFEKSDLTNRELGELCVISWWMNWEMGRWKCIEANAHPTLQTLFLLYVVFIEMALIICKLELSECIHSVSNLDIEITFTAAQKKASKCDKEKTTAWLPFFLFPI